MDPSSNTTPAKEKKTKQGWTRENDCYCVVGQVDSMLLTNGQDGKVKAMDDGGHSRALGLRMSAKLQMLLSACPVCRWSKWASPQQQPFWRKIQICGSQWNFGGAGGGPFQKQCPSFKRLITSCLYWVRFFFLLEYSLSGCPLKYVQNGPGVKINDEHAAWSSWKVVALTLLKAGPWSISERANLYVV